MELQSEPKLEAPTRRIDGKTFGKSKDSLKTKSATERFKKQRKKKYGGLRTTFSRVELGIIT